MIQFTAMLADAYRELNSKKLFWVTLVLSGLFVAVYGSIGFDPSGLSMLYGAWHIESEFINSETRWSRALYLGIFSDFVVNLWLAWIAIILALISTTTIFPDFMAGGAIDLMLPKPIGRLRLFAFKYITGLLFVLLQMLVFCTGVFLCVGVRLGEWNWLIFAAVPMVTLVFSYLFAFNTLVAVVTRSALAALLLTLLFWFGLWTIQTAEGSLFQFRLLAQVEAEEAQQRVDTWNQSLAALDAASTPADDPRRATLTASRDQEQAALDDARRIESRLIAWHTPIRWVLNTLPKTQETTGLVSRWLKDKDGYSILAMLRGDMTMGTGDAGRGSGSGFGNRRQEAEVSRRMEAALDARSPWMIVGSSVAFEVVLLLLAAWVFCRRDY